MLVDDDIGWFDVPMDESLSVSIIQSTSQLAQQVYCFVRGYPFAFSKNLVQRAAIEVLHHRVVPTALLSYALYLKKALLPHDLAVFYPYPSGVSRWTFAGACLVLAGITFVAMRAKDRPYLAVGWLWYLVTLVPVIGLVQVGGQAMADRYTYVPGIGLFIMAAWGVPELFRAGPLRTWVLALLAGGAVLACMMVTPGQVSHWRNTISLFSHALAVTRSW